MARQLNERPRETLRVFQEYFARRRHTLRDFIHDARKFGSEDGKELIPRRRGRLAQQFQTVAEVGQAFALRVVEGRSQPFNFTPLRFELLATHDRKPRQLRIARTEDFHGQAGSLGAVLNFRKRAADFLQDLQRVLQRAVRVLGVDAKTGEDVVRLARRFVDFFQ